MLKLFIALQWGVSQGTPLYKRAVCRPLADAMALRTYNVCFWIDGGQIAFSLRSAPDGLDVSEIAERFGSGGHLRIPRQTCHRFQVKPATDSIANLPSISGESCHRFHRNAATRHGAWS
jgi:hypothetical protein